jgi:membrane-bound lytic murein transglycosylase B
MTIALPLSEWRQMGVRTPGGAPIPAGDQRAAMVSGTRRHFLVYPNYDALLQYNCAHSYALAVALLGDRIESASTAPLAKAAPHPAPKKTQPYPKP